MRAPFGPKLRHACTVASVSLDVMVPSVVNFEFLGKTFFFAKLLNVKYKLQN